MSLKTFIKGFFSEDQLFRVSILKQRRKYSGLINETRKHQNKLVKTLRNRNDSKIRIGMYVVYDSSFGGYELFEEFRKHQEYYSVKIVIIPDISRGNKNLIESYEKTKVFFVSKYGAEFVEDGYCEGQFIDRTGDFDLIYFANPYDTMVHEIHGIEYASKKEVLPIYIGYCFTPDNYSKTIYSLLSLALCWKVFSETRDTTMNYHKYGLCSGKNVIESGYPKMDSLFLVPEKSREKTRIVIAPHHTVGNEGFPLSTFLKYKDFYLSLPEKFPNVDFVFRPHPLLFITMINKGFWTEKDKENYLLALKEKKIQYSFGGSYFDVFKNSDAMIHDCSSFLVEYLFTGKPCCFLFNGDKTEKCFNKLGKMCLSVYTRADSEEDIINFIEKILNSELSEYSVKMKKFLEKDVMINYPESSCFIFRFLDKKINNEKSNG